MYLGVTPFPISTRNSAIGVAHLASKTAVRQMFVSTDPAMQRIAREANEILARGEQALLHVSPTNTRAVKLYESMGFVTVRELALVQARRT